MHSSLALPYSSCVEATYFKFSIDIPCSMDKKIINFVFSMNLILKKKFHLFVAHPCKFGNHFSVAGVPFSCDDRIMAYPSHWVNQTPNIGGGLCTILRVRCGLVVHGSQVHSNSSGVDVQTHDSPSL